MTDIPVSEPGSAAAESMRDQAFEPDAFPLDAGIRLLEASAGTGKTFALAHLVLRLVAERGLNLRRLLVVTFTEAAAAELRDRIGRRLQDGLQGLEDPPAAAGGAAPDPVLRAWLATCPEGTDRRTLQGRLLLALEDLDAADITTIHGFCHRTLQRQTLAAGLPPELRIEDDADGSVRQVVHDYWQRQVLTLPAGLLGQLRQRGITPARLRRVLERIDGDPTLDLDPLPAGLAVDRDLPETLPVLLERRWSRFREEWERRSADLDEEFRAAATQWRALGGRKTTPYSPRPRRDRRAEVDAWLERLGERDDEQELLRQELLVEYFHPAAFSKVARDFETADSGAPSLPQRPLLEAVADLVDGPVEWIALHACHWGRRELRERRRRRGMLGFSQLLEALDPADGEKARLLLQRVGRRHDVALIDEFQDTDPIQWRILRRAFGRGDHLLVMVGDPKQAIYRFRGGDLATYRTAGGRADVRFELGENHRATPALVDALNALMAPGLRRSALAVPAVRARADRSGPEGPPIELLWLGGGRAAGDRLPGVTALEQELPGRIATHVVDLLERGLELGRNGDQPQRRPLRPDDICLLVDSHRQAEAMRQALEQRGIASRLVSQGDVFASPAATALQRALDALADPADPNRLRLLAASPLLAWSAAELASPDSLRWSALAGSLEQLAAELPARGLLGVLSALLDSAGLARLAVQGRMWADLQQAAQLVGERLHAEQLGPAAIADWLRRVRHDPDRAVPDSHQTHSDRVDGAVSVVTIHRSKGLEYPVVICPTLWREGGRSAKGTGWDGVRWLPPGADRPRLDLHGRRDWGAGWAAARQDRLDRLAERERIAYVAVTRAQHLLVLAWGPAAGQSASPLFPWLFASQPLPDPDDDTLLGTGDDEWRERLAEEFRQRRLPIRLVDPPAAEPARRWRPPPPLHQARRLGPVPRHHLDTSWGRSSYTSWTRSLHRRSAPVALEEGRDTDDPGQVDPGPDDPGSTPSTEPPESGPLGSFPRGAAAGECLHRVLECLDYRAPLSAAANQAVVERELQRAGLEREPLPPLLEGLERVRVTPFGGPLGDFRLADLAPDRRLNEMNFDLCLERVEAAGLAAPFRDHPGGAFAADYAERIEALPIRSRGFLTGSIDLVFPSRSRWWVLDWKSNWLGDRDGQGRPLACGPRHYGREAMADLMVAHHYPLQAHLYLVALHRYLGWRLPGYDPQQHLGGYAYVFLRGVPPSGSGHGAGGPVPGLFLDTPPLARLQALDAVLGRSPAPDGEP